ncbi:hypothetical protein HJC23_005593 [Cyclotella cryptica]|uniref:Uncharacterized protein n=1 Tax=Cyclotella cryptica TaxID=29204 RepID=A0ABD3PSH4_9STRA|eukprot:CCRYP_012510-RA/>CCRYP_012510-RA protein AED:0.08 eAED:0.08 QI:0/-1/0/1/-1/1/1/0/476
MKRQAPPPATDSSCSNSSASKRPTSAPDYGSKSYWEARYKSHLSALTPSADDQEETSHVVDGVELSNEAILPGHAWYFTYDELRPLILPLILGEAEAHEEEALLNDFDEDEDSWEEASSEGGGETGSNACEEEEPQEEEERENGDEDEKGFNTEGNEQSNADQSDDESIDPLESYLTQQQPRSSPKSILEIGCGDVPLGSSLTTELNQLQSSTGCNARMVVSHVTCIDYSEVVIENLIRQQQEQQQLDMQRHQEDENKEPSTDQQTTKESTQHPPIHPTYATVDARSLPYPSNSYSLLLEKGTMDAMLSHPTEGISNSISIMKEMARVCAINGAILIVSHLNARCEKGMGWVENVVIQGLREEWSERRKKKKKLEKKQNGCESEELEILWSIEVHGGEANYNDDEGVVKVKEDAEGPSYGPAVYILKKKGVAASIVREITGKKKDRKRELQDENETNVVDMEEEMPPVKLEFLTYS